MKVSRLRLAEVIHQRLQETRDLKSISLEIAAYLLTEGRVGELDSIMRDVMQLRADQGVVEVVAVDAYPLNETIRSEIADLIRQFIPNTKDVIVSESGDRLVLGGTKLIMANQQLDMSIRAKLNRFKQLTAVTGGA